MKVRKQRESVESSEIEFAIILREEEADERWALASSEAEAENNREDGTEKLRA